MEIYINERPSALPAALAPMSTVRVILTVDIPLVPQAHQVSAPAPVERQLALVSPGTSWTGGFTGKANQYGEKRTDVRGVPPRGRPV